MNSRSDKVRVAALALSSGAALLVLATLPAPASAAEAAARPEPARHHFSLKGAGKTYPRKDEVAFGWTDPKAADSVANPFAVLKKLKDPG